MDSSNSSSQSAVNLMVEAAVRKMMQEMNVGSSSKNGKDENSIASFITDSGTLKTSISNLTPTGSVTAKSKSSSVRKTKDDGDDKSETRSKKKTKKTKKTKSINSSDKKKKKPKKKSNAKIIEQLLTELALLKNNKKTLEIEIPSDILLQEKKRNGSNISLTRSVSTHSIGSAEFYDDVAYKLKPHHKKLGLKYESPLPPQGSNVFQDIEDEEEQVDHNETGDFDAAFGPNDMRCLALVSHNDMKSTMKEFVIHYKHTLKKFRLTGTNSTMKMLKEVFADEPSVVFGPECKSGPLGGDAELVAHMTSGKLGGILFFQDPMSAHPHQADIDCLVRQAQVHNTIMANTPTTAMALAEFFRMALIGEGRPHLLPSFFFDLESPVVRSYKTAQKKVVNSHKTN